jgi:hypothetical protein
MVVLWGEKWGYVRPPWKDQRRWEFAEPDAGGTAMSDKKLRVAVDRLNELRHRLEPVEQHWGWTAEQLHRELRHVLHSLNGLVTYLTTESQEEEPDSR